MENIELEPPGSLDEDGNVIELDRAEALVRLLELAGRYSASQDYRCPYSAVRAALGIGDVHPFGMGCCRGERDLPPGSREV